MNSFFNTIGGSIACSATVFLRGNYYSLFANSSDFMG